MPELQPPDLRSVRAIFFDLDDTLCGYWTASKAGLRAAFEQHGPPKRTPEGMVQAWGRAFRSFYPTLKRDGWYEGYLRTGEPTRTEQMRRTLAEVGIQDEEMAQALSAAYRVERNRNLVLFPEAIEVLTALHGRYPLGLITNGPADIQREEIATCGMEAFFEPILIEGEMGYGKPDPRVYRRAEAAVGASPGEILMVGNSYPHDIQGAMAQGWRTIWISRPTDLPPSADPDGRHGDLMPEGAPPPDAVIGDLREILPLLGD